MTDFAARFHAIEGITVDSRKKQLYKLLNNFKTAEKTQLEKDLIYLTPKTDLEELFKVESLIYFRIIPQLLETLKKGNEIHISKIIKHKWFIQEAFTNMPVDKLVNKLIPNLSYNMRIKLLKNIKLHLPETKLDEIYKSLYRTYGQEVAQVVLLKCSKEVIESVLIEQDIKLTHRQAKNIFDKDATIFKSYIENNLEKNPRNINFRNGFYQYVAKNNPNLLIDLIENHDLYFKLGRRTTKCFLEVGKEKVIEKPFKYCNFLKHSTLVRRLRTEFPIVYKEMFPVSTNEHIWYPYSECHSLLKEYNRKLQFELFLSTFNTHHPEGLEAHPKWLSSTVLHLIENPNERTKWTEITMKNKGDESVIHYLSTEKSIPLIKELINTTSKIQIRAKLLCDLIQTCKINKDLAALESVLSYMSFRHRNEEGSTIKEVLNKITNFKLETFNEKHWLSLLELIKTLKVKKERFNIDTFKLLIAYIDFCINNKRDYMNIVELISTDLAQHKNLLDKKLELKPELHRLILLDLSKKITLEEEDFSYNQKVIAEILKYNLDVKNKDKIDLFEFPALISVLEKAHKEQIEIQTVKENFYYLLRSNYLSQNIFETFWTHFQKISSTKSINWLLKHKPEALKDNFERIIEDLVKSDYDIWLKIKFYKHIGLDKMVYTYCLDLLGQETVNDLKEKCFKPSAVLAGEHFPEIINKYIPDKTKVEVIENMELYELQCAAIKSLKEMPDKDLALNLILKFCIGDYLKLALTSLYSVIYRNPERNLPLVLKDISKGTVALRKHALHLSLKLMPKHTYSDIVKSFDTSNTSSFTTLIMSVVKYFAKNPSHESWALTKPFLDKLENPPEDLILKMIRINILSKEYKHYIYEKVWDKIKDLDNTKLKAEVLDSTSWDIIKKLPDEFCLELIKNNFLDVTETTKCGIGKFVWYFLMYSDEKQRNTNFQEVFQVIKQFKRKYWTEPVEDKTINIQSLHLLYSHYRSMSEEEKGKIDLANWDLLIKHWKDTFTSVETINEYVGFHLARIFNSHELKDKEAAKKCIELAKSLKEDLGDEGVEVLVDMYRRSNFLYSDSIIFYKNIIECELSVFTAKLTIRFLRETFVSTEMDKRIKSEILSKIKHVDDRGVKIMYNYHIRNAYN